MDARSPIRPRDGMPKSSTRATRRALLKRDTLHIAFPILFAYLVFKTFWSPTHTAQLIFALISAMALIIGWKRSKPAWFGLGFLFGASLYIATSLAFSGHGRSPPYRLNSDFTLFAELYARGGCRLARSVAERARDPYSNDARYDYSGSDTACELISVGPDRVPGGPPLTMAQLVSFPNKDHFHPTLFNLVRSRLPPARGDAILKCGGGRCDWVE